MKFVAVAAATASLAACGGGAAEGGDADSGTIRIGAVQPFSGDFAKFAEDAARGNQLAIDKAGGKVAGRSVELVRGDASTADQGVSEVQRLATRENVDVFTGTYISAVGASASETAARQNKVYWENHALANDLTERDLPTFVRGAPRASTFADASASFITDDLAERFGRDAESLTVYIEHEDSVYGTSVAEGQRAVLERAGVRVITGKHAAAATDLTDAVLRAKSAQPDVWLITGYVPDVNLLLRQAAGQGFEPPATVLTGTGDSEETLESVGPSRLAGTFVVQYSSPLSDARFAQGYEEFLTAYRRKYGGEPLGGVAMTAYAGMTLLLRTLEENGARTDPESFRRTALALDLPVGELPNGWGAKFDATGQNTRVALVTGQWRPDGTLPTVFPSGAATSSVQGVRPASTR